MNALEKYRFCFLAGMCAAGGSFFGKLPSVLKESYIYNLEIPFLKSNGQIYCAFVLYQFLPIALMILCNLLNWRYFLKALQMTEQTLTATVLTAASNYMTSFILGCLIFKEPLSLLSVLGSGFIIFGLWFLCVDDPEDPRKSKKI